MTQLSDSALQAELASAPDIVTALTDADGRLTAMEKQLAEFVLADVNHATNASITEIAIGAGVSPPTVTRFCRRLGCASFSDFKLQLARSTYVGLRYLKPESVTSSAHEVAEDIVTKAQNALFEMHRRLDLAVIEEAVRLLSQAGMIYGFGSGGNSSMIVNELQNRLFRLGCQHSAQRRTETTRAQHKDKNNQAAKHKKRSLFRLELFGFFLFFFEWTGWM